MATYPTILAPLPDEDCGNFDTAVMDAHAQFVSKLINENEKVRDGYEQIRQGLKESLGIAEMVVITFEFKLKDVQD